MNMIEYGLALPGAYLLGSISWGYLAGKLRGVDIRQMGSGSTGMTNVLRTFGPALAILVLMADVSKGVLAVLLARALTDGAPLAEALAATLAVVGHNWPVFSGFRGGRGIATGVGALTTLNPLSGAIALIVFLIPVAITRYVSLGSMLAVVAAMVALPLLAALDWTPWQYSAYVSVGGPLILWQHRSNLQRLLKGAEHRLGERVQVPPEDPNPRKEKR